jgi:AcrR family transcriptional regulator
VTASKATSHRRAVPKQARAAATFDRILQAAVDVLVNKGLQGFNTNIVAEVAGVNVATVYHYFPDKNSILREMFERNEAVRVDFFVEHLALLPTTPDLEGWTTTTIETLLRFRRQEPAGTLLRRAWRALPELTELEDRRNAALVSAVQSAFQIRFPHQTPARLKVAAQVMLTSSISVLDQCADQPRTHAMVTRELVAMLVGYLELLARPVD